ncbi:cysteine desulfurase family protein [Staphylococcus argenteus]|uniref:cysteine desulfurase family protein n=2 Tax=Staphylococcus TaxID=1279 RepID=UPI000931F9B9|nr:cysteine desulfurase family protein [Staphylococcus argenteus]MBE2123854.1 cysteine desulfurase [Staphylococcus argenteus]MBE2140474.1 cysteine desulfurase [Staphylococcus argenteus]MCG6476130.1 cysteine desulfurase [Staphylococcus argenteus]MDH9620306.1 cysteine desulfurase family protein [Staphylococcus argenteus]MDH9755950.1 cysteine desulfurase family protein [Staphylococcus argenteus]
MFILIYLDNAATTKAFEEVLDTYLKVNQSMYFNPSSPHKAGLQADQLLQQAKVQINNMVNANKNYDVVFTSGATESNNIALKGVAYRKFDTANVIITSVLEHPSVLEVVRYLEEREGFKVKYVDVTKDGSIDLQHFNELMSDKVGLVTCMYVNNVTGQIQPIAEMAEILKQYPKVHFHVDAVQAFGKIPADFKNVDSLSLSGHKFNGLKGQGVLLVNHIQNMEPIIQGGGQEYGVRSGTINLPSDIALVKAMKIANDNRESLHTYVASLNKDIREFVESFRGVYINSAINGSPFILNISFPGVKGEVLVNAFSKYDIMVSTTSACSSKRNKLNEVLTAMGLSDKAIEGSIRLSFGATTTKEDIEKFKETFIVIYEEIKELLK